jgi:hypothetical protein
VKKFQISLFFTLSVVMSGCISYQIPNYSAQIENTQIMDGSTEKVSISAEPAAFEDSGTIYCRGTGPVRVADGKIFTDYIVTALQKELDYEGIYHQNSDKKIHVKLTKVDFSSALGATNWYIDGQYEIDKTVVAVSTVYNDRSSYFGDVACRNMAAYFPKAVAKHLNELYREPTFRSLVKIEGEKKINKNNLTTRRRELQNALKEGLINEEEYKIKRDEIISQY